MCWSVQRPNLFDSTFRGIRSPWCSLAKGNKKERQYQRLEWFGDAVLQLLISKYLFCQPDAKSSWNEGDLTELRKRMVNNEALAYRWWQQEDADQAWRCPGGMCQIRKGAECKQSVHAFLCYEGATLGKDMADRYEAFIGAVYLEQGDLKATWEVFQDDFEVGPEILQQYLDALRQNAGDDQKGDDDPHAHVRDNEASSASHGGSDRNGAPEVHHRRCDTLGEDEDGATGQAAAETCQSYDSNASTNQDEQGAGNAAIGAEATAKRIPALRIEESTVVGNQCDAHGGAIGAVQEEGRPAARDEEDEGTSQLFYDDARDEKTDTEASHGERAISRRSRSSRSAMTTFEDGDGGWPNYRDLTPAYYQEDVVPPYTGPRLTPSIIAEHDEREQPRMDKGDRAVPDANRTSPSSPSADPLARMPPTPCRSTGSGRNEDFATSRRSEDNTGPGSHMERVLWDLFDSCFPLSGGFLSLFHRPSMKLIPKVGTQLGEGITWVTLLTEREDSETIISSVKEHGMGSIWVPLDASNICCEEFIKGLRKTRRALNEGKAVVIHCSAGMHRTGAFGYAILRVVGAFNPSCAQDILFTLRSHTKESEKYWPDVDDLLRRNRMIK
eukprot:GEMP01010906.1.p1 GENE.GEMP01010906.1~~GEMP01010906.1.p1  ORF type:complete len:612 (+),score=128.41 GEMP01010906.1:103-1938(+)